jgi:hypothetical protein
MSSGFAEPGALIRDLIRTWPNLTETTVNGTHFIQEDSPTGSAPPSPNSCGRMLPPNATSANDTQLGHSTMSEKKDRRCLVARE